MTSTSTAIAEHDYDCDCPKLDGFIRMDTWVNLLLGLGG